MRNANELIKEVRCKLEDINKGFLHIRSTFHSILMILKDSQGNLICWTYGDDSKKTLPRASYKAASTLAKIAKKHGIETIVVMAEGPGCGREIAIRIFKDSGISINIIKDCTPIIHHGISLPKKEFHD